MKKINLFIYLLISFFFTKKVFAVCPVCTVTVAAGLGISRFLGIDDIIPGLWIGAILISMIIWTLSILDKKDIKYKYRDIIIYILYFGLLFVVLYFGKIIGNSVNVICNCGIDRLVLGIALGALSFYTMAEWYFYLKEKNNGHAYFPFQKVVMPVAPILILSIIFYLLTN